MQRQQAVNEGPALPPAAASLLTDRRAVRPTRNCPSLSVQVGSGTDPTEGAALASSLLERLHSSAALTYATTHHAELKVGTGTGTGGELGTVSCSGCGV